MSTVSAGGPAIVIGTGPVLGQVTVSGGIEVTGSATVVSGAPQIADVATAPLDLPVALRRGSDGLLRPDRAAIADRPTRDEVDAEIVAHVLDPDPHPTYDDIPDLTLWYRNALI